MLDAIAENLSATRGRITESERRAGREPGSVELLAVSKTYSPEVIQRAVEAGQLAFGENRVQELETKVPALGEGLRWHLIGHLQKNKVRKVLPLAGSIHSIDSIDLARRVDRIAGELELRPEIYLQVNVGEDEAKFGLSVAEVEETDLLPEIKALPHLELAGLMTVPPLGGSPEEARPQFAALRALRDRLETAHGIALPGLSMGMSGDFEVAIEEGATLVRVGSTIFGERA